MNGATLTCGELFEQAGALAARFAAAGVGRGDRVVLILPAGLDFVRHFFALQLLGASSCAMNPTTSPETALERAARARPRMIVTEADQLPAAGPRTDVHEGGPDDLAFLQLTSGTSGEPRLAMVLQRNVLALSRASAEGMGLTAGDIFVSWAPPWHDLGLVRFIILPLYLGAPCHLVRPAIETIPEWLRTIEAVRGTTTGAPDFAYRLAARMMAPGVDLTSLRHATNGGEPVRAGTIAAFEEHFGVPGVIRPGYGLAEATLGVTTVRAGEPIVVDASGAVSCGLPLPGVEVRIDNGEILVRGDTVFAGYFDAGEETAKVLEDGWLRTGDLGRLGGNGELYVLGRKKSMIKRGGAVLAPRELEETAQAVRGVKIAAAVGVTFADSLTEEIVVAIEVDAGDHERISAEVSDAIVRALGFAPEHVAILPPRTIPRTSNGKIRHDALRRMLLDQQRIRIQPVNAG